MSRVSILFDYLLYLFRAKGKYRIHSPFVYNLLVNVIQEKSHYDEFGSIEEIRRSCLKNKEKVEITDYGTVSGDKELITYRTTLSEVTRRSSVSPGYGELLFRLARHFNPRRMIELGTSVGISTAYLAKGCPSAEIITIEGCRPLSEFAGTNFKKLGISNVKRIVGHFDKELPTVLEGSTPVDMLFVDGNHRGSATIDYFYNCLDHAVNESLFIFDDIHWSEEMNEAWRIICRESRVKVSIDLFAMGLVFFRRETSKQDFLIRY